MLTRFADNISGSQVLLGERTAKFKGGGMVQIRTASEPSRLRGAGLDGVVLDEAAYMKAEAWYQVLSPALADRNGWALFISTPAGYDNWFAELFARAHEDDDWAAYKIPSAANPKLDPEEIRRQQAWLPPDVFAQEFLGEFVVPGGQVFKSDWFHYYEETDAFYVLDHRFITKQDVWKFCTVDLSVSTKETADYTVIATWAVSKDSDLILLDLVRKRMEGPDIIPALQDVYQEYRPGYMAIERVGFQLSIVQEAIRKGLPVKEMRADKDKLTRALPAAARMESGKIWFPRASNWLSELERELLAFPKAPHDDQCFTGETLIRTDCGDTPIRDIRVGDHVLTRQGYKRVINASMTNSATTVHRVLFSDGTVLRGTPQHPIWVVDKGFVSMDTLAYADIIEKCDNTKPHRIPTLSTTRESPFIATQLVLAPRIDAITVRMQNIAEMVLERCTKRFGKSTTVPFQRAITFITKMVTPSTMLSKIWNAFRPKNINAEMLNGEPGIPFRLRKILTASGHSHRNGTDQKKVERGTANTAKRYGQNEPRTTSIPVGTVGNNSLARSAVSAPLNFVPEYASTEIGGVVALTTKPGFVLFATLASAQTNTEKPKPALPHVVERCVEPERQAVYNITVEGAPEYYANCVLVHNCDVLSYAAIEASGLTMSTFDIGKLVESRDPFGLEAPSGAGWSRNTDRQRLVESEGFIDWSNNDESF